jgi:NAD(P)H-flavin reductase
MLPRIARVRRCRREGPQVWTLEIEEEGGPTARFAPGQFNMLTVFGVGDIPISLSGDPASGTNLVHTIRAVGAVSRALVRLRVGDAVGLRGPFGRGWPIDAMTARDVIVIAGGLGIAPLRPALYRLIEKRKRFGSLTVLCGARGPDDILFGRELDTWRRRSGVVVEVTVDHAKAHWSGHVGVVTTMIPRARLDPANTSALVCGPEIMMRFTVAALRHAGLADDSIYLSLERNMKCAVGLCGHCQFGPAFVCKDGPVFRYDRLRELLGVKEI